MPTITTNHAITYTNEMNTKSQSSAKEESFKWSHDRIYYRLESQKEGLDHQGPLSKDDDDDSSEIVGKKNEFAFFQT